MNLPSTISLQSSEDIIYFEINLDLSSNQRSISKNDVEIINLKLINFTS